MVLALWLAAIAAATAADAGSAAGAGVDTASHIVVGTVQDVAVVSFYNNLLYRLNPEPRHLTSYTAAQLQIVVDEVLYPPHWTPAGTIKYLFGDSLYPLARIKHDTLGKRLIFVLQEQKDRKILDRSAVFFAGGDAGKLGLPLTQRAAVERLIAQRLQRERAAANAGTNGSGN
jgi:hypothetical protein